MRLKFYEREFAGLAEYGGRKLAAGIAIDTGGVDKKVSRNVFGQSLWIIRGSIALALVVAVLAFISTGYPTTVPASVF